MIEKSKARIEKSKTRMVNLIDVCDALTTQLKGMATMMLKGGYVLKSMLEAHFLCPKQPILYPFEHGRSVVCTRPRNRVHTVESACAHALYARVNTAERPCAHEHLPMFRAISQGLQIGRIGFGEGAAMVRKLALIMLLLLMPALMSFAGSRITRSYVQRPLSEVLIDIDKAAPELHISFIYNKLEDYPVTCSLDNAEPADAIRQVIGFYPVKMTQNGSTVVVEPIYDTAAKVSGRVVDSHGRPLEFAHVALLSVRDSTFLCGGVANASGDFVIPCMEDTVQLKASFIGYGTATMECTVGNVGTIVLAEDAIALAEVRKNGTRPLAKMERGALVYDMEQLLNVLPADNAYEALTRIPGVNETSESIEFAGQGVTLIVNGKATAMDAERMKERLKQMPTDRLATCEVMMAAPARYHARGAVINIVTKDLYGKSHASGQLTGMGNFSERNYGFGSGAMLYANGRVSLDANYSYYGGGNYQQAEHRVVHPLATGPRSYHDVNRGFHDFDQHGLYAQMEYAFAPNHRLSLTYNGLWNDSRNHNVATGTNPSEQRSSTKNQTHNVDVNYSAPFGLKLGASYIHYENRQAQQLDSTMQSDHQELMMNNGQTIDKWDLTADQSHTIKHDWTLSYGAEMKLTKHNGWQETRLASGLPVDEATSSLGNTECISSVYTSLGREWKKLSAEVGAQAESYHTPQWNEWRIYPTMNLLWKASQQHQFNLSLSSNSTYPRYWSMMSGVYYSSGYSEIWGNPELKPMNSYAMSLMWQFRQRYTLTAVYQIDDDYIAQLPYQPADRMAVVMQEVNFTTRRQLGLLASAQWKIGKWANGSVGGMCGMVHEECDNFHDIPFNRTTNGTGRLYGTAAIRPFEQHSLTLMVQPVYQFKTIQGVYDIHAFFRLNASLRWTDKTGRLSVSMAGSNITNECIKTTDAWRGQNFSMAVWQNWRSLSCTLTYRLGNYKAKQHKQVDTSRMGH